MPTFIVLQISRSKLLLRPEMQFIDNRYLEVVNTLTLKYSALNLYHWKIFFRITVRLWGNLTNFNSSFPFSNWLENTSITTQWQYLLHVASDSSEPSGHSSSPSHFHRDGMQWPLLQVKSVSAQVFLAGKRKRGQWKDNSTLEQFYFLDLLCKAELERS